MSHMSTEGEAAAGNDKEVYKVSDILFHYLGV